MKIRSRKQKRKHNRHHWRRVVREAFQFVNPPHTTPMVDTLKYLSRGNYYTLAYIKKLETDEGKKQQWINEMYALLCKSQGNPSNSNEEKNMREWASVIYNQCVEDAADGWSMLSPEDAHWEEMQAAS